MILVCCIATSISVCAYGASAPPYPADFARELTIAARSDLLLNSAPIAIDSSAPVNDVINGRYVSGQSRTVATGVIQMVPHDAYARFVFTLKGSIAAQTATDAGPATIYANSQTSLVASQGLTFNEQGFLQENPQAACRTSSVITGVSARGPIIRRIAWRRAQREKPQAEYASARRAEEKARTSIWERVREQLAKPNDFYRTRILPGMRAAGIVPRIGSRSSTEWLTASIGIGDAAPFAGTPLPPSVNDDVTIQMNIHPQLSSTLGRKMLAGKTLTDEDVATFVETVYGEIPADLRIQSHRERWELTFADVTPFSLTWSSNAVASNEVALSVSIRLKRLSIAGTLTGEGVRAELDDDITISAAYLAQMLPTGPHLSRLDDVRITHGKEWPDDAEAFVTAKFEALLGESVYFDGLSIPAGIGGDNFNLDRLRSLKMRTMQEQSGWLAIGWGLP